MFCEGISIVHVHLTHNVFCFRLTSKLTRTRRAIWVHVVPSYFVGHCTGKLYSWVRRSKIRVLCRRQRHFFSLERRWSSRRFPYGYLVTTSPLSLIPPWAHLRETSDGPSFTGVTGSVYKTRERIHRSMSDLRLLAIPTSWSRIADSNPNWDRI